jgi:hypothetical protein
MEAAITKAAALNVRLMASGKDCGIISTDIEG